MGAIVTFDLAAAGGEGDPGHQNSPISRPDMP
jgi:hypothetical protein